MEAEAHGRALGPMAGGARSAVIYVLNATALDLELRDHAGKSCRWPVPPPPAIPRGTEAVLVCESAGGMLGVVDGGCCYAAGPATRVRTGPRAFSWTKAHQHPLSARPRGVWRWRQGVQGLGAVEFKLSWESRVVSSAVAYAGVASPGWRAEREYLTGAAGRHTATRFVLTRALPPRLSAPARLAPFWSRVRGSAESPPASPPMAAAGAESGASASSRPPALGEDCQDQGVAAAVDRSPVVVGSGGRVRVLSLDAALDASTNSRFGDARDSAERARHIAAWLAACSPARSRARGWGGLDVVALQGVLSESSKRELLPVLSQQLGLVHVVTGVGARTMGVTVDAGMLLASRFPVLHQKFSAFPAHPRCAHPAMNPQPGRAPGAKAGILAALLDTSSQRAGTKLFVFVTTAPDHPAVWRHIYATVRATVAHFAPSERELQLSGAVLLGTFEGMPVTTATWRHALEPASSAQLQRTFIPRDVFCDRAPAPLPALPGSPAAPAGSADGADWQDVSTAGATGAPSAMSRALAVGTYSSSKFPRT
jgi:hypothetical protein